MQASRRNKAFGVLLVILSSPLWADETSSWELSAAEWSRPRSAATVIAMPAVADAVRSWQVASAGDARPRLQLLHASGEEGSLWAAELRDWLIALGVPSRSIELAPGGLPADRLQLRVTGMARDNSASRQP